MAYQVRWDGQNETFARKPDAVRRLRQLNKEGRGAQIWHVATPATRPVEFDGDGCHYRYFKSADEYEADRFYCAMNAAGHNATIETTDDGTFVVIVRQAQGMAK